MNKEKILILTENIEKTIIHFLLKSKETRNEVLPKIREEDFLDEKNKFIFIKISELVLTNKNTLDLTLFANKLELDGNLKKIGGIVYLTEIADMYIPDLMIDTYIEALINNSTKRKIESELIILKNETNKNSEFKPLISTLRIRLNEIEDFFNRNFKKFISLSTSVKNFFEDIENYDSDKQITGFKTGFRKLDKKLKGLQKGDLIILAARPSMGKTTLALNMVTPLTDQMNGDGDIIFFSLEMSSKQLAKKIIKSRTKFFNLSTIERKEMPKNLFLKELEQKRIFIDNSSGINISEIGYKLREWNRKSKINLVVIDYLQLLSSIKEQKNYNNRNLEVSTWTRQLKELAREINAPILCLSQLSRGVEKREDKRPLLSDLRDSGSIEQDADVVMFLYREHYYEKNNNTNYDEQSHDAEINIAKHRNGPVGKIEMQFSPEDQHFFEISDEN